MTEPQTESSTIPETDTDFACFVKAKDKGEVTFTLRSQDVSAPDVVDFWANINQLMLGKYHPKIVQARQIAEKMRHWPTRRQAE